MIKNGIQLNSRSNKFKLSGLGGLTYYPEIPRTSDLLKTAEFSVNASTNLQISKFYIAPATIRFDDHVEEALFELNKVLTSGIDEPSSNDILNMSVQDIIVKYGNDKAVRKLRDHLISEGHTGKLIRVASQLNASRMDQLTRAILSEEGIFFYLAYKAIIGHNITKDSKGIATNILESLGVVKSHINGQLVDKVIDKERLHVLDPDRDSIRATISKQRISYFHGAPSKAVRQLVVELKPVGKLEKLVMNFLNSGRVKLPKNTNKTELAQKMVNYLLKIGYNEDFVEAVNPPNNDPQDPGAAQTEDLEAIKGIGEKAKETLVNAGILTFSALAELDEDALKTILQDVQGGFDYDAIIDQAKLVADGRLKEFIELRVKI